MSELERAAARLALTYAGPGGAVAVLRDGELLLRHAWGYADIDRRLAFTPATLFRICSISKQFTCALMLDRHPLAGALDPDVKARLPLLETSPPLAWQLAHNQSGLRDYWAAAMLCGSPVEAPFGDRQSDALIGRTRTLQFAPGSRYSYCNQNFRLLGEIVAARAGDGYASLLRRHVFDPAGMPTAALCADTQTMPDGTSGYEGTLETGFRAAVNRIEWTGDAGIGASLDDMIAWERFIDATRDRPDTLYQRLCAPVAFNDGTPALYGFGLSRMRLLGRAAFGHGGGLRGWRSVRFYLPAERISIVVLFNHMADPRAAALDLLATLLEPAPARPAMPPFTSPSGPPPAAWAGTFQEPETGLILRLEDAAGGQVKLHYSGQSAETLDPVADGVVEAGGTQLRRTPDGIWMDRRGDHQSTRLVETADIAAEGAATDVTGMFHNAELDAKLTVTSAGGTLYGAFSGLLGQGWMQILLPAGRDLWRLPMPRALDNAPPGDWTLQFHRGANGAVASVEVGCWLARRVMFTRAER